MKDEDNEHYQESKRLWAIVQECRQKLNDVDEEEQKMLDESAMKTFDEIAEAEGLHINTVYKLYASGMHKIQAKLKADPTLKEAIYTLLNPTPPAPRPPQPLYGDIDLDEILRKFEEMGDHTYEEIDIPIPWENQEDE